jgi:hypothetical protein
MSSSNTGSTFMGFAAILAGAGILCFPTLGWQGLISAICAIYFGLALTNGGDTAAKRKKTRR